MLVVTLLAAQAAPRLQDPVRPTLLAVELDVDPAKEGFSGTASLGLEVLEKVTSFHLHGDELTVTSASVVRGKKSVPARVTAEDGGRLRIEVDKPLKKGAATLVLAYEGTVHEQPYGLFRFEEGGRTYLATQLEADDARTVWPCFDEPAFKVPFQLAVTVPAGLEVISNGAVGERSEADGRQTVRFEPMPAMPTYAAALAIGPYASVEIPGVGVPSRVYVPEGGQDATPGVVEELPRVVAALQDWFGEPYPYGKLDLIAVTDFTFGAMENPGAVVMNQRLLNPPERERPAQRAYLTEVLAHEVGHMWFGNLVTMAWWDDFWLNESFAQWIGGRTVHALHPGARRDLDEVRATQRTIVFDGMASSRPLRTEVDPAAVFETANFDVYPKGEALLTMVEAWIGQDAFRRGLRDYLSTHRWGNARAEDLFAALSKAGGVDIQPVMAGFLDRPGAPLLAFDGSTVTQSRYARIGAGALKSTPWTLPLRLRVGRPDGSVEVVDRMLTEGTADLALGEHVWVLPTADGVGYYAWDQTDAGWEALLTAAPGLDAREQVVVLGEIELLVDGGRRDAGWALGQVAGLGGVTDPEVLTGAIGLADYVSVAEDLDDEALEAAADAWTRASLRPWLDTVGLEARAEEPASAGTVRRQLLQRLGDAGDPEVLAHGDRLAKAWLADAASVPSDLGAWATTLWVKTVPASEQAGLFARAKAATNPRDRSRFLNLAGSVRGEEANRIALERALGDELPFADMFAVLGGVGQATADDDEYFVADWMMGHYDEIVGKLPPQFRPFLVNLAGGCDVERFERLKGFFMDPARHVPGTDQALLETEERVRGCVARRATHGASVRAFLAGP